MVTRIQLSNQLRFSAFGTHLGCWVLQVPSVDTAQNCHPTHPPVSGWGQVLSVCMCFGQYVLLSQPGRKYWRPKESFTCSATSKVTKCDRQEAVSIVSLSCLSNIAE